MKRINLLKMSLDTIMVFVFVLLFNKRLTGLSFHESAGLTTGGAFVLHKAINWRWILHVTANIFEKKLAMKTKIGYIVDVLLLMTMGYIIISGVLISKILFPNLRYGNEFFFKSTHIAVAYISLSLVGIHIGLHWQWVMNLFNRKHRIAEKKSIFAYLPKLAVILIAIVGIYGLYSTSYFSHIARINQNRISGHDQGPSRKFPNGATRPEAKKREPGTENEFRKTRKYSKTRRDKELPSRHGRPESSTADLPKTLISYFGIIALFSEITYYIEKLLNKTRIF